jgi:hypothetical protein
MSKRRGLQGRLYWRGYPSEYQDLSLPQEVKKNPKHKK